MEKIRNGFYVGILRWIDCNEEFGKCPREDFYPSKAVVIVETNSLSSQGFLR